MPWLLDEEVILIPCLLLPGLAYGCLQGKSSKHDAGRSASLGEHVGAKLHCVSLIMSYHVNDDHTCSFLQVLTDLCEIWYALWMDDREIFRVLFPTKESAEEFVNDLLARRFEACHSGLRAKAAQRRELDL